MSGFSFSIVLKRQNHGVGGRAFDRVFVARPSGPVNRLPQRERLGGGAALVRRRDHGDRADFLHRLDQRAQARRVNPVVVGDQNIGMKFQRGKTSFENLPNPARGKMVGTTGFEPATSRTPSVRATRLRYVPTAFASINQRITRVREGSRQREIPRADPAEICDAGAKQALGRRRRARHCARGS